MGRFIATTTSKGGIDVTPMLLMAMLCTGQFPEFAPDPRARRAAMEKAVAGLGGSAEARGFIEEFTDEAVVAVSCCNPDTATQLARFHSEGRLGRLARPRDIVAAIGRPGHGTDVARFVLGHESELGDSDCCDAFLIEPLVYAMRLKSLQQGAAEVRTRRLAQPGPFYKDPRNLALAGAAILVLVLVVRAYWRRRGC